MNAPQSLVDKRFEMWAIVYLLATGLAIHLVVSQECDHSWSSSSEYIFQPKNYYKIYDKHHHKESKTLRMVHIIFRHGERTPDPDSLYPLDPYNNITYSPYGYGQLTNLGKKQEYQIGKTIRKRYDSFLGDTYIPDMIDARSTDYNRTKMSLELMLAGLWPPNRDQMWNYELPWLPIPYNYWRADEDTVLGDPLVVCPKYKELYEKNLQSEENVQENEQLSKFYNYLSYYMGTNISLPMDVYNYFFTLHSEEDWGLQLPDWTKCVWPDKFLEVTLKQYDLFTQSSELIGLSAGQLIDKIIKDSKQATFNNIEHPKLYIYSGHERNIAFTLIALGVYYPHMPPYASYVLIELHEINGVFGFKVYYQDYTKDDPILLIVPGCDSFCPFETFYKLIYRNLPHTSCTL